MFLASLGMTAKFFMAPRSAGRWTCNLFRAAKKNAGLKLGTTLRNSGLGRDYLPPVRARKPNAEDPENQQNQRKYTEK